MEREKARAMILAEIIAIKHDNATLKAQRVQAIQNLKDRGKLPADHEPDIYCDDEEIFCDSERLIGK